MRTVYISDDGKSFEDKKECLNYEQETLYKNGKDIIVGLDAFGEKIDFSGRLFCDNVTYLYLKNDAAVNIFLQRLQVKDICSEGIEAPGFYLWNNYEYNCTSESWTPMDEVIELYKKPLEKLVKMKETLEN